MEFHVAQLLREPTGSRRDYELAEQDEGDNGDRVGPHGEVHVLRTDAGILVTADLTANVDITCSRCLVSARTPCTLHIEEEYYPTVDVSTGAPLPLPQEPTFFLIDAHHILNLDEAIRQQRILAEPMQPLCRPDCAGLCPTCGADRNLEPCTCHTTDVDPRWSALLGLEDRRGA